MTTRRTWGLATVVIATVLLAGCSWRMETPPPQWPSPDAITVMRDSAAEREHAVVDAASFPGAAATTQTEVLSELERASAPQRLTALGGLYIAYPDASPSPSDGEWTASEPPDLAGAVTAARDGHLADALVTDDEDLAAILTAAGLSHALSSWYAIWVDDGDAGVAQPVVEERLLSTPVFPEPSLVPQQDSTTDLGTLSDLALAHDQARYAYEVLAARAQEDERDQWLARRDLQASRGAALAGIDGVEDRRQAVYVLTAEQVEDAAQRLATAVEIENGLGAQYAALAVGASLSDTAWLLCAAFDAYAQAAAYGEPGAEAYAVPALPGIEPAGDA